MSKAITRAIANHKEKKARRNFEKDSKYIVDDIDRISSAFTQNGIFGRYCNGPDEDASEDDASSVSSFSTTATTDDNPGAGYTIDKYFYQPVGRRIEKIAFRIAMPLLSPVRIFQYIEEHHFKGKLYYNPFSYQRRPIDLKTVYLAGLDSLLHQTRSNSLMRSSAALSALIRLCPTDDEIARFFYLVQNQIGHPSLVLSMIDNDTQEKKCYLFLITLIWARPRLSGRGLRHGNSSIYTGISHSNLKETLLKLVKAWHNPNKDAFAIMSEASLHFSQALNYLLPLEHSEDFELVYFFTIFIVRFIPFIYNNSTRHTCGQQTHQLCHMLLLTFLRWLDSALFEVVFRLYLNMRGWSTLHMLQTKLAIDSLLLHDPVFATLLPASTCLLRSVTGLLEESLPRNRRHRGEHLTITDTFIRASIARTQRLLTSLDELEREIRDSMSRPIPQGSQMSYDKCEYTLGQARCVDVLENEATKEFLRARKDTFWEGWREYKLRCQVRHEWGIYLRSNLDWDWDTASCLERLFEIPEEVVPPTAPIVTVSLDAGKVDAWNVTTESNLPKEVKFVYKSATGEMKYRTILFCSSSDDVASAGHIEEAGDEASAIAPESHCAGGEEVEDGPGAVPVKNSDTAPMRDTDAESGVEQVDEKLGEATLIAEEPNYGAAEEDREGSKIVGHDNNDAPRTRDTALGPTDNESGDETTDKDALGELLAELDATEELHADQISICSLD